MSHAGQRSDRGGGRIRVAVADEEVLRRRLTTLLAAEEDIEVVGEVGDGMAAIGLAASTVPDVIVMDVWLPKRSGFDMWVLTDRELEVLSLTAEGLANREIAKRLYISENTARNHARNILQKRYWHIRSLP